MVRAEFGTKAVYGRNIGKIKITDFGDRYSAVIVPSYDIDATFK
jgi:hypothetical protein